MGVTREGWGALYMVWGHSHDQLLDRSIAALKKYHPDLPIHVHRVPLGDNNCATAEMFLPKAAMATISPFERTLYLDADTIVMGPLDYAFEKAEQFGLAGCICECPWAQRYAGLKQKESLVEYNTGVLFFTPKAEQVLYLWERLVRTVDSSVRYIDHGVEKVMQHNDQAAFAWAMEMSGFNPYVLPLNWNFRPKWNRCFYGPIRIWHDVNLPPAELYQINALYDDPNAIYMDVSLT